MYRRALPDPVTWLSEIVSEESKGSNVVKYFEKFKFKNLVASVGDYVLISNADAAEPDTEEGCDVAQIIALYENRGNKNDPFRAKVRWYSKPSYLPNWIFNNIEPISFAEHEVVEDHRPFDTDVSIETFFKPCTITFAFTYQDTNELLDSKPYHYICRYRLITSSKRKGSIQPVLEQERKAIELLSTPKKDSRNVTPKTPNSLVKRMSRVSLSEPKNWSVSKSDGTKLLLKRAILADKTEKESPKKVPPANTPKKTKTRTPGKIVQLKDADLLTSSDSDSDLELPTLIIRQSEPATPKKTTPAPKPLEGTPKKTLSKEEKTRSARKIKGVNYTEEVSSDKKKGRLLYYSSSSDEYVPRKTKAPKTPTTPRTPRAKASTRTPRATSCRTPKTSNLTPTLRNRANSLEKVIDYAKQNKSLPGREGQMNEILYFVRSNIQDGASGCMYIAGVPGTGKTATVNSSLQILKEEAGLPTFELVEVNGMRIAEPRQAYVQIYRQLTGKSVTWEQACALLEKRFTNPMPRRTPTVLLVDELDALCTRRQDVLYNIMEWASHNFALLTVIAVANTMDLPERAIASRVSSRLGLTRLTFPPYTHTELQKIVATRLADANVTSDAQQLIARKVAAVSGDARRALALCSRASELAAPRAAGLAEVAAALAEAASGAAVAAIRHCSPGEQLMLRAVASEVERTGTDETTLSKALNAASAIVALEGRPYKSAPHVKPPTPSQAQTICARLAALRLLLLEPKAAEPRLLLNVSADDVHYATRQIMV